MKLSSANFLRYRKGEMSAKEKNLFERELQKDPFAEEAADGLSSIAPDDASADIKKLYRTLERRVKRSRRFIIYRIAASIAVLMIISSVFIVLNRKNTVTRLSETAEMPVVADIRRDEPIVKPDEGNKQEKKASTAEKNIIPEKQADSEDAENDVVLESGDVAKEIQEAPPVAGKIAEPDIVREYSARSMNIAAAPKTKTFGRVEGTIYSAEDDTPVPGASIVIKGKTIGAVTDSNGRFSLDVPDAKATLVASYIGMLPQEVSVSKDTVADIRLQPSTESLSEVVVGYGVQKKSDESYEVYVPPRPVPGQAAFNRYIEDNIVRPDSSTSGQRAVVVIGFHVLANGAIDSIKIIRSPGKAFSDEAIRLVKSGPKWQPAIRDGVKAEDDVRIRIVFK